MPLVPGDKLWIFHTSYEVSGNNNNYFTTFDGATWESSWHRLGVAVTYYEVAPVYNPVTGRIVHTYLLAGKIQLHLTTSEMLYFMESSFYLLLGIIGEIT